MAFYEIFAWSSVTFVLASTALESIFHFSWSNFCHWLKGAAGYWKAIWYPFNKSLCHIHGYIGKWNRSLSKTEACHGFGDRKRSFLYKTLLIWCIATPYRIGMDRIVIDLKEIEKCPEKNLKKDAVLFCSIDI